MNNNTINIKDVVLNETDSLSVEIVGTDCDATLFLVSKNDKPYYLVHTDTPIKTYAKDSIYLKYKDWCEPDSVFYDSYTYDVKRFRPMVNKLITKKDLTKDEYKIAKYLFNFLWNSDNGTNTMYSFDLDDIDKDKTIAFVNMILDKWDAGCLDLYLDDDNDENNGVEIYWGFLALFDLTSCDFLIYDNDD